MADVNITPVSPSYVTGFTTGSVVYSAGTALAEDNSNFFWNATTKILKAFGLTTLSSLTVASTTATPAGGSTTVRLLFGTTAGFGIYIGSGVPTVSAAQGSLYLRSDGSSTSTRLYVNTNGTTGWTAITTAT